MALTNVYFFSVVLVAFVGILACKATKEECTDLRIQDCVSHNQNSNGCFFHEKIEACINDFIGECSGQTRMIADQEININRYQKQMCPGFPDGQCWQGAVADCLRSLWRPDSFYNGVALKVDAADCVKFKKSASKVEDCLQKVDAACISLGHTAVEGNLKTVHEDRDKICGKQ